MWKCKNCGNELDDWAKECYKCNTLKDESDLTKEADLQQNQKMKEYKNPYSQPLKVFAIIELIISIILTLFIWANSGMELGIVVLIQGIVVFVILSALVVMSEDIAYIKNQTMKNN